MAALCSTYLSDPFSMGTVLVAGKVHAPRAVHAGSCTLQRGARGRECHALPGRRGLRDLPDCNFGRGLEREGNGVDERCGKVAEARPGCAGGLRRGMAVRARAARF